MYKFALIGYPLGHSLSPVIHQTAMEYCDMLGSYELLPTPPEDLVSRIKYLKVNNYNGFNITIPHKVPITFFLSSMDEVADLAGAVNTVIIDKDKELHGYNTDVHGFVSGLSESMKLLLKYQKAVIFGTGGASRAVVIGLSQVDIKEIDFYSRDISKIDVLKKFYLEKFPQIKFRFFQYTEKIDLSDTMIAVNTTPLGMLGKYAGVSPVEQYVVDSLPDKGIVYDIVYNPVETEFIKQAKKRNLKTVSGINMLVNQGLKAFELWTGKIVPANIVTEAVLKRL